MNRLFAIIFAVLLLLLLSFLLLLCLLLAAVDTQSNGLFFQKRIGRYGKPFTVYKLMTMHAKTGHKSIFGTWLRKTKIDELPQLINIIKGDMSFVGPRPDVAGYADQLTGSDCLLLSVRPGVTGLASLKYKNEEALLAKQTDPKQYNDEVIWPDKVQLNNWYVKNKTLKMDLEIIFYTLLPIDFDVDKYRNSKSI
ncbi:sugar transferase [Flavobacterium lacus]|uniref:Lipopolysaccharide/colanic/teichoic acid biosynthesis glycosyltransferase n=1 Tax=Flavobacterium lacus TaxID=1353778 RepID=A0A328WLS5_9FLAO|nr:sugar transferase [Flavobacterium lacus]RAR47210.1 lipopolysaccharide/colanic/teichoic acid biosynthesis glycosyltransferase [Flavobacterium lacus]